MRRADPASERQRQWRERGVSRATWFRQRRSRAESAYGRSWNGSSALTARGAKPHQFGYSGPFPNRTDELSRGKPLLSLCVGVRSDVKGRFRTGGPAEEPLQRAWSRAGPRNRYSTGRAVHRGGPPPRPHRSSRGVQISWQNPYLRGGGGVLDRRTAYFWLAQNCPKRIPLINQWRQFDRVPNPPSPLLKADTAMIAFSATSDGSLRVRYASWEDAKVFRPEKSFELVARNGHRCWKCGSLSE